VHSLAVAEAAPPGAEVAPALVAAVADEMAKRRRFS